MWLRSFLPSWRRLRCRPTRRGGATSARRAPSRADGGCTPCAADMGGRHGRRSSTRACSWTTARVAEARRRERGDQVQTVRVAHEEPIAHRRHKCLRRSDHIPSFASTGNMERMRSFDMNDPSTRRTAHRGVSTGFLITFVFSIFGYYYCESSRISKTTCMPFQLLTSDARTLQMHARAAQPARRTSPAGISSIGRRALAPSDSRSLHTAWEIVMR